MNMLFEEWIERLPTADNIHRKPEGRLSDELSYSSQVPYSDKHNYYSGMLSTDDITNHTKEYTNSQSGGLNEALYLLANTSRQKMTRPLHHKMEQSINDDIHKAPSPSEDLYVYSGIKSLNPANLSNRYVHIPQFMSTSLLPHVAKEFSQMYTERGENDSRNYVHHVLRIKIPAFSNNGLYLANHSHYPKEEEFLLKNNNVLHISNTPHSYVQQFDSGNSKTIHLWDAHIIMPSEHHLLLDNEAIQEKLKFEEKLRGSK